MSNLGPYQDITTAAKRAGGVDALLNSIKDAAVSDAAPRQRAQGGFAAILGVAILYGGYHYYVSIAEKRAAIRAAGLEAETKLREQTDRGDSSSPHAGEPPTGSD